MLSANLHLEIDSSTSTTSSTIGHVYAITGTPPVGRMARSRGVNSEAFDTHFIMSAAEATDLSPFSFGAAGQPGFSGIADSPVKRGC